MSQILLCVNSDLGRGNTIGTRFERIARASIAQGGTVDIIARANYTRDLQVAVPWYRNILARAASSIRMYSGSPGFFHRFEIQHFDAFVLRQIQRRGVNYRVAHLGAYLPRTTAFLKKQGTFIYLDIPIAHPHAAEVLKQKGMAIGELPEDVVDIVNQVIHDVDCLIVPSAYVQSSLREAGFDKRCVVVPFGADSVPDVTDASIMAKMQESQKKCIFLFAGAVNKRKGVPYLIAAWKKANISDAELILCGRVYQEVRELLHDAERYHIVTPGFTALDRYFREGQVFVFPSLLEGSAKAVYEAMSYGLPVITTPNAGSVVEDGVSGYIIPAGDVQLLTQKMQQLSNDPGLRTQMGIAARKRAQQYNWDRYAQTLIQLYQAVALSET